MNDEKLNSALNAIGKECFISYLEYFVDEQLSNEEIATVIQRERGYTHNSCRSRTSKARSILKSGRLKSALEIIIKTDRTEYQCRQLAQKNLNMLISQKNETTIEKEGQFAKVLSPKAETNRKKSLPTVSTISNHQFTNNIVTNSASIEFPNLSSKVERELTMILGRICHHVHPKLVDYIDFAFLLPLLFSAILHIVWIFLLQTAEYEETILTIADIPDRFAEVIKENNPIEESKKIEGKEVEEGKGDEKSDKFVKVAKKTEETSKIIDKSKMSKTQRKAVAKASVKKKSKIISALHRLKGGSSGGLNGFGAISDGGGGSGNGNGSDVTSLSDIASSLFPNLFFVFFIRVSRSDVVFLASSLISLISSKAFI